MRKAPCKNADQSTLQEAPPVPQNRGACKPDYSPPAPRNQEIGAKNHEKNLYQPLRGLRPLSAAYRSRRERLSRLSLHPRHRAYAGLPRLWLHDQPRRTMHGEGGGGKPPAPPAGACPGGKASPGGGAPGRPAASVGGSRSRTGKDTTPGAKCRQRGRKEQSATVESYGLPFSESCNGFRGNLRQVSCYHTCGAVSICGVKTCLLFFPGVSLIMLVEAPLRPYWWGW